MGGCGLNAGEYSDLHGLAVFRLDGTRLALPVEAVREVVPIVRLARPPQAPAAVAGFLDLAGDAVLVLHLDRLLGCPDCRHSPESKIIVLRGRPPLGLLVAHVESVRTAAEFRFLPVPPEASFNGCVAALLDSAAGPVHLLAAARLLLREEQARLADYAARAQARRQATAETAP
jgi:purine-binding chemotaxis protein CheW